MNAQYIEQYKRVFQEMKASGLTKTFKLIENARNMAEITKNIHHHPLSFKANVFLGLVKSFETARAEAQYALSNKNSISEDDSIKALDQMFSFMENAELFQKLTIELSSQSLQCNEESIDHYISCSQLTESEEVRLIENQHKLFRKFTEFEYLWLSEEFNFIKTTNRFLFKEGVNTCFDKQSFRDQYKQAKKLAVFILGHTNQIAEYEIQNVRKIWEISYNIELFNFLCKSLSANIYLNQINLGGNAGSDDMRKYA